MVLPFLLLACDQSCEKDVPKHYIFTAYFLHDQSCEALEFSHGFQWDVQMGDIWMNLVFNGFYASSHHWSEAKQIKLSTRLCSKVNDLWKLEMWKEILQLLSAGHYYFHTSFGLLVIWGFFMTAVDRFSKTRLHDCRLLWFPFVILLYKEQHRLTSQISDCVSPAGCKAF